jgi:hypothetical protein
MVFQVTLSEGKRGGGAFGAVSGGNRAQPPAASSGVSV